MRNRNREFLESIAPSAKADIIDAIAKHYGQDAESILMEVTASDAEDLLDYMIEPERSATSALMQKHGFRGRARPALHR